MTFSEAQISDVIARADVAALAGELGAVLRKARGKWSHVGSCPLCGGSAKATRFACSREKWACAACSEGGDAIALLRKATGCDFAGAIERLGGARLLSREEEEALARKRAADERRRAAEAERYRRKELEACRAAWEGGRSPDLVARYLAARGCALPSTADLRDAPERAYIHGEEEGETGRAQPRVIWRGPAMLAAIRDNDGAFAGLHATWLAPDASAKAALFDPETGEALPAKKVRGLKLGGHVVLRCASEGFEPRRLFIGEGIETVLSVASALRRAGRLQAGDVFWSSVDLYNLGGPHRGSVAHPSALTPKGRPVRVPGPEPEEGASIALPESVRDVVLLGDGDSEPFLTRMTLERARARWAKPGRRIAICMAPEGQDFNDMVRGAN